MKIELKKWELTDQDKEGLQRVSNGVDRKFLSNRLPYPYTKENATWWINFTQEADGKNGIYRAIIVDGQYVGNISAEKKEDVYCKDAEIGYLFVFLSLAFGMALLCSLLRLFCPVFQNGIGNLLLLGVAATTPTIAAILTVRIIKGGNELATFLSTHYKQNFSLGYCIIAFAIPMLFLSIGKLIIYFVMPSSSGLKLPTIKKGLIILWALIAEELGWRGYLQEQIERRIGSSLTPLVVGLIWALWHFHFWMIDGIDVPITVFTYGAIAESYGYYMITKLSKGNILPASIWHTSSNLFFNLYLIGPSWNVGSIIPYLIINGVYTMYILIFFIWKNKNYILFQKFRKDRSRRA